MVTCFAPYREIAVWTADSTCGAVLRIIIARSAHTILRLKEDPYDDCASAKPL